MAITVAKYTFNSWLRKGIGANIREPDTLGSSLTATKERAIIPIDIKLNTTPIRKEFALIGPGDIIGINPQMVVRTEPLHQITNYEPNFLPFVEFYDEDFIWRYTPARASDDKMRPWLVLLVLEDNEDESKAEFIRHASKFPLPTVVVKSASSLPLHSQTWAWGHVHTNDGYNSITEFEKFLQTLHNTNDPNADKIVCRLMSSRNLKPNLAYRAFVVPAFETGRLAGLGQDPKDVEAQKPSWDTSSNNIEFPIYYEWYFRTGEELDFEELAKLLEPWPMDKRVGIREMNASEPGFGMTIGADIGAVGKGEKPTTLGLEGALKAPTTESRPKNIAITKPFFGKLQDILNFPVTWQLVTNTETDPVVCPPIYGENHLNTHQLDITKNGWLHVLNKDPRNRVPAGFGVNVIHKYQEDYVAKAWEQVKKILDFNRQIVSTAISMNFSLILVNKFINKLSPNTSIIFLSSLLKKVKGSPTTLHFQMQESVVPTAAVSVAFRRMLKPRGAYYKKIIESDETFTHDKLITEFNEEKVSAAPPKQAPPVSTVDALLENHPLKSTSDLLKFLIKNALLLFILLQILALVIGLVSGAWILPAVIGVAAVAGYVYVRKKQRDIEWVNSLTDPASMVKYLENNNLPKDFKLILNDEQTVAGIEGGTTVNTTTTPVTGSTHGGTITTNTYFTPLPGGGGSLEGQNFKAAALELNKRLAIRATDKKPNAFSLPNAHTKLMHAVDPRVVFPKQLASQLLFTFNPKWLEEPEHLVPAMLYPDFEDPMYEKLRDISSELLIPNLELIPPNTISLLTVNPPFIESYMVGLNHEFGKELLWREYPTDKRGSYFRQFWDVKGIIAADDGQSAEDFVEDHKDIIPIDQWTSVSELGRHKKKVPPGKQVVLVVRGELLKKYPNTIIYAQKAHLKNKKGEIRSDGEPVILEVETKAEMKTEIKFPLFKAAIEPDLRFFGFDLIIEQAKGAEKPVTDADDWGWYFVIQQVPGEPQFGMDIRFEDDGDSTTPLTWDDLSWEHFDPSLGFIDTSIKPTGIIPKGEDNLNQWGANSANMAYILYQKPVMIAIHAKEMLAKLEN